MSENFAIERLAALLHAGYEIDHTNGEAVTLRHPAIRSVGHVYADGLAVLPDKAGEVRFFTDSPQDEFYAFVRTIPKPGWRRSVRVPQWVVIVAGFAIMTLILIWMT